jgi:phosphoglycolate phosphatase
MQYDLVIFDLDGTLIDTSIDVHVSLNLALQQMNLPTISMEIAKKAIGPGPKDFVKYVLGDAMDRVDEFHQVFRPIYWERCADNAEPFDGIIELLKDLHDAHIKCAVATNKAQEGTHAVLNGLELEHHFDFILSRDQVEHPKPAPDMLLTACAELDVHPDRALMLGDTDNDILAANAAGIKSALALWGFSDHFDDLKKIATFTVEHPLDVMEIIEREMVLNV